MSVSTPAEMLAELRGTTCRCGREKDRMKSFCLPCFMRLPRYLRTALYKRIGTGYETAYESAVKILGGEAKT
jgi:hypothetical protein